MNIEHSLRDHQATGHQTLDDVMRPRLVLAAARQKDWQAFATQEAEDPRHRRAQIRYMHSSAMRAQPGLAPASSFLLVNIAYPPGHYSPMHRHDDAEEVFFILQGTLKIVVLRGRERYESVLGPHDMLSVPAGEYRQEINVGDCEALACVIVGAGNPSRPDALPVSFTSQE